jgi:nicotinate-nucleotide pyrophosphorylase (carboxylating)
VSGSSSPEGGSRPGVSGSSSPEGGSRPGVSGSSSPEGGSRPGVSGSSSPEGGSRPDDIIALALAEDLGDGDVTAAATIPAARRASARLVAREPGVVAGIDAARRAFALVDADVDFAAACADGDPVQPGSVLATVAGRARSLVTAERTALNLVTHLSGVATLTSRYVAAVAGTSAVIRDTRKTMPGLRALEKSAVAAGGGVNHRFGLFDGLLVKDNHAAAAGGVGAAARAALAAAGPLPVQVEVDDAHELEEALAAGARAVLVDNHDLDALRRAVARCRREPEHVFVEASGGVTLQTVAGIAATGVDAVAVGALTHSARSLDIALDFDEEG